MKKLKRYGSIARKVADDANSTCGSARLAQLDWAEWFTDGGGDFDDAVRGQFKYLYLHVRRNHPELDGGGPNDETWHRVHPKLPRRKLKGIRLTMQRDGLYWLFDVPIPTSVKL